MTAKEGIQDRFQLKVELTFHKELLYMSCMIMPIIFNIILTILTIIDTMEGRFTHFKSVIKDQVISSYIFELAPTIHAISNIGIELCAYANTCIPS